MGIVPINILSASDATSQTGNSLWVGNIVAASFVALFGDTSAAGTIQIQASNAIPTGVTAPVNFTPPSNTFVNIPNATATVVAGVAPAILIPQMTFGYIRAVFTSSSAGSTTININAHLLSV